jgi:AraC-like DNA-binding protein
MMFDLTQIIGIAALIQVVFLSVVAFNYKKGKKISNRMLGGFLILNAVLIANWLTWELFWFVRKDWRIINMLGDPLYLLLMPFLYVYLRSLCYSDFRLRINYLLHVIPYVAFIVTDVFRLYVFSGTSLAQDILKIKIFSYTIIWQLQVLIYLIASVAMLSIYRKRLKEFYSSIEKIDLAWCNLLIVVFGAKWCIDISSILLESYGIYSHNSLRFLILISLFIKLLVTLALSYKGLMQSESFSGIRGLPKYATSRLKSSDYDSIVEKLIACMKMEKPYLMPSLTIEDLSKKLNFPARHLSQAIHSRLNQNFQDFINSYRIEESKKYIHDESYSNRTLLAVAYDAGFNSKSVFNASFRKLTGMTPKEYKRMNSV